MYYYIWPNLLALIKKQFMEVAGIDESAFDKERSSDRHRKDYSLKDYRLNLYAEGCDETEDEIAYIASRKALNYNLFGAGPLAFRENGCGIAPGVYHPVYKQKIPLIQNKNTTLSIDTLLIGEEEWEIVRTRFLEWIVLKNRLIKETFLDERNYFDPAAGKIFAEATRKMLMPCAADGGESQSIFSHIDALFIIKELIAAYNLLSEDRPEQKTLPKKINIVECYWKPKNYSVLDAYAVKVYIKENGIKKEHVQMMCLIAPVLRLFEERFSVSVDIRHVDVWKLLLGQKDERDKWLWMKRYKI